MALANGRDENSIELTIPPFLRKTLGCFSESNVGDVTHIYNITLKSMDNRQLFVNDEEDLRNVLIRYLMYRKLCRNIEKEMVSTMKQMDKTLNNSKNKNKTQAKKLVRKLRINRNRPTGQTSMDHGRETLSRAIVSDVREDHDCASDCKHVSHESTKKCCIIL